MPTGETTPTKAIFPSASEGLQRTIKEKMVTIKQKESFRRVSTSQKCIRSEKEKMMFLTLHDTALSNNDSLEK